MSAFLFCVGVAFVVIALAGIVALLRSADKVHGE